MPTFLKVFGFFLLLASSCKLLFRNGIKNDRLPYLHDIFYQTHDDMHQSIRSNIVRIRKAKKLSQEELAERIGMSTRNLQRLEAGEAKTLDASTLIGIAEALGVGISDLYEQASIYVDTIHHNNGIVGSGNLTVNNTSEDLLKCLQDFARQQQIMFDAFSELLKNIGKK